MTKKKVLHEGTYETSKRYVLDLLSAPDKSITVPDLVFLILKVRPDWTSSVDIVTRGRGEATRLKKKKNGEFNNCIHCLCRLYEIN